ncbi:MAG: TonB family protein [Chloroherpetonaceae bacterium]
MKNIMLVMATAMLLGGSEKLFAQTVSAPEAQDGRSSTMKENCVQTIVRGKVQYPALARLARLEGKSLYKVHLDENGRVLRAELLANGNPILDEEALRVLTSETAFKGACAQKEVVVSVVFKLY